jgi:hypothetical protein
MKALRTRLVTLMVLVAYLVLVGSGASVAGACCALKSCRSVNQNSSHCSSGASHRSEQASQAVCQHQRVQHACNAVSEARPDTNGASLQCRSNCGCAILPVAARSHINSLGTKALQIESNWAAGAPSTLGSLLAVATFFGGQLPPRVPSYPDSLQSCIRTTILLI